MQNWPIKSPARQHQANQDAQCHPEYTDNWDECPFRGELLPLLGVGNYVLLVLYSIESCARAFAERERFLCNVWNVIDLVTVLLGWMSLLLQNIINPNLLRLSRLVRVPEGCPSLYFDPRVLFAGLRALLFFPGHYLWILHAAVNDCCLGHHCSGSPTSRDGETDLRQ